MTKRTAALIAAGTAASSLSKWYLIWLFARTSSGAEAVGVYSSVLAFATPLFVVCQFGLRTTFLSASKRWPWVVYWRLRLIGCVVGLTIVMGFVLIMPGIPFELGLAIAAMKIADSIMDLCQARVQYANRMSLLGRIMVVNAVGTMVTATLAVMATGWVAAAVFASALVSALAAVWSAYEGRRVEYEATNDGGAAQGILTAGVPITTSQFLATLLFQLPVLGLTTVTDATTVGVYAGAAYFLTAASLAGATLQTLLITPFRRRREKEGSTVLRSYASSITIRTLLGAAGAGVVVVLVGSPVLTLLYGPEFAMSYLSLALLAVAAAATVGAFVQSVVLTVLNRYASVTSAMGLSCAGSVAVGVILLGLGVEPLIGATAMAAAGATLRLVLMLWFVKCSN